ncbi:ABC transporter ATP-binding protein [Candidatus Dependentiae bacterium]|nr:ABC transporter ATP-binding protein [Candidatus Dependentiae bacterium]MBU4387303.1 ABC transporter ATP-binding protein [Candidatus Dependentiae bacterium]MCG2756439.1 ABC transporter ATP-binding protein [Candidatus Dependentiae bacterium]
MIETIKKLNYLLSKREKRFLILLFFISVFVAFLETFSISLVMVFASIATNFNIVYSNKYYNFLYNILHCNSVPQFIVIFGLALIIFYFLRAIIITIFTYAMNRFSQGRFRHFAIRFFQNYLNFAYKEFTTKNSSKIDKVIFSNTNDLVGILDAILQIMSEFLNVLLIYTALLFVHLKMTIVLSFLLLGKVFLIAKLFSKKLKNSGKKRQGFLVEISKTYTESFWNFKLIKLFFTQDKVLNRFNKACSKLVTANTFNAVLQNTPRLILETIGFSTLIAVIVYVVYMYHNATAIIPVISMYAFAFYRFLPSINKILSSYNRVIFLKSSLDSVNEYLGYEQEDLGDEKVSFKCSIVLKDLSFEYDSKTKVLGSVNIKIEKGQRTAFVGESGAGKSTIADVIMGLYRPTTGDIFIDDHKLDKTNIKSWRQKIGYIPQQIYLFDGTVADNVVFGRNFNKEKIVDVLKKSNIYNFLLTKDEIYTKVGDGGILLSGGQKQRIAIARALYSDPELLVLDEATSALDNQTEENIMNEIYSLNFDKTLIVIAHRLSTVERCDKIYKIDNGNVYLVEDLAQLYIQNRNTVQQVL